MASPTIESLCCLTSSNEFSKDFLIDFHTLYYNLVSILASVLGICGALFQIFRKENVSQRSSSNKFLRTRGRVIIKWLAMADLMAASGILIRSISWVSDKTFGASENDSILGQIFCVVTSGWIHYFYTATYIWTFIYALDVKLVLEEKKIHRQVYHILGWVLPAILCLIGLLFLYLPDLNCYNYRVNPYWRFLPNYLSTFLPIVLVMITNPILYIVSFSSIEKLLVTTTGRYTQRERQIVRSLKMKFLLINVVFFVCWLPNVFNGIILWTAWQELPRVTVIVIWYLMAILNPLQAVFNCFVYRNWASEVTSSRPFWVHPVLWLEESLSLSSSGKESDPIREISPEDIPSGSRYNPFKDVNPWQRLSSFGSARTKKTSEKTPLLSSSSSRDAIVVSGEQSESSTTEICYRE